MTFILCDAFATSQYSIALWWYDVSIGGFLRSISVKRLLDTLLFDASSTSQNTAVTIR